MPAAEPDDRAVGVVLVDRDAGPAIKAVAEELLAWDRCRRLVVVDDGSTDGSAGEVAGLDDGRLAVVTQPGRLGVGAAWRRGLLHCPAGTVVLADAARTPETALLDEAVAPVVAGDVDVVRVVPATGAGLVEPFSSTLAHGGALAVANRIGGAAVRELVPVATVLGPEALARLALEEDGVGVHAELVARAGRSGLRTREVQLAPDAHGGEREVLRARDAAVLAAASLRWSPRRDLVARPRHQRPTRAAPASFDEADAELAEALDSLNEDGQSYADWVASLCEPYLGADVLEVGAGHGSLTARFAAAGRRVTATDLSPRCVDALRRRFDGRADVDVVLGDVMEHEVTQRYDSVVLVNVLEHVPDDVGALARLTGALRPGGHLVVFVPAFEGLYSDFDRRVGHVRRYRRAELLTAFADAGLEPVEAKYVNSVGALAWWFAVRQLGLAPTTRGLLRVYDRWFVPVLRRAERGRRPPFGQSLFVAGRRPPA